MKFFSTGNKNIWIKKFKYNSLHNSFTFDTLKKKIIIKLMQKINIMAKNDETKIFYLLADFFVLVLILEDLN